MTEPTPEYKPSLEDQFMARESYVRYLAGAAIIHNPIATQEIHTFDPKKDQDTIVTVASRMMVAGLNDVIAYAHPPDRRTKTVMYEGYKKAQPHMMETVEQVSDRHHKRIQLLGDSLALLLPAPMLDAAVYRLLCKVNHRKLTLGRLLEPVLPAPDFRDAAQQSLIDIEKRSRAA